MNTLKKILSNHKIYVSILSCAMVTVCIAEAVLNIENSPAAIAWTVACSAWLLHVFANQLTKEDIS